MARAPQILFVGLLMTSSLLASPAPPVMDVGASEPTSESVAIVIPCPATCDYVEVVMTRGFEWLTPNVAPDVVATVHVTEGRIDIYEYGQRLAGPIPFFHPLTYNDGYYGCHVSGGREPAPDFYDVCDGDVAENLQPVTGFVPAAGDPLLPVYANGSGCIYVHWSDDRDPVFLGRQDLIISGQIGPSGQTCQAE